jgi:Transglycosylase SLT domain
MLLAVSIFDAQGGAKASPANLCEQHLARISKSEGVPLGVLYAVGLTETGRKGSLHPYALNIEGRSVITTSAAAALHEFSVARKAGIKLIDLGCMQVNHYYHGDQFASPADMLDPVKNIEYAARFLQILYKREGSWTMAVARYHASAHNKKAQKRYICSVIRNLVASDFGAWTADSRAFCKAKG